ncbi:MAG: GNAT family N-acetyltransferase [Clostridiaceae bacterium]|nr:GNAT family N-acetyltransferase [Clostridiaceae bacterium]MBW4860141.1 GNAT family N-acetyltransferase [Clostridiaceae bacterium]MBW4869118.1 GNAT family N-acetyltransferase [Clostridiaceae bacterium]
MDDKLEVYEVITNEDVDLFWKYRDRYMVEDIIPNSAEPFTREEKRWFFSQEYRDHIIDAYERKVNKLHIVFFLKNKEYVGFAAYVIYHSEDGKCFIVEYCIEPKWRNQGLGTKCFQLIERKNLKNGASYFELNFSNEDNKRFWESNGFIYAYKDEYGSEVYMKRYKEK